MAKTLGRGEPEAGPWRGEPLAEFMAMLLATVGTPPGRPPVLAIDGRSSSGKTTLSQRLSDATDGAEVVHTDDIAWWHSRFDWADIRVRVRAPMARAYHPHAAGTALA